MNHWNSTIRIKPDAKPPRRKKRLPRSTKRIKSRTKSRMTADQQRFKDAVKNEPCCACGAPPPSDPHHPQLGTFRSHWALNPLCRECHEAPRDRGREERVVVLMLKKHRPDDWKEKLREAGRG